MGGINVYITKIINTYGSSEMIAQAIDDLSNEMYKLRLRADEAQ